MVTGVLAVAALQWIRTTGLTDRGYDTLALKLKGQLAVKGMLALSTVMTTIQRHRWLLA
jgi:hypothetical protein